MHCTNFSAVFVLKPALSSARHSANESAFRPQLSALRAFLVALSYPLITPNFQPSPY